MSGYVYVLSNPCMPGIVKVGKSVNGGRQRSEELYTTGVPTPFEMEFEIQVDDPFKIERLSHNYLNHCRISKNREFFNTSVREARDAVLLAINELKVESREPDPLQQEKKTQQEFLSSLTEPWEPKATAINPINTREKVELLPASKQPYWFPVRWGAAVGVYVGTETRQWVARAKGSDRKYHQKRLGDYMSLTYEQAADLALRHAEITAGTNRPGYTVADVIADYVKDLATRRSLRSAYNVEARLKHNVPPQLQAIHPCNLKTIDLIHWRDGLVKPSGDPEAQRKSRSTANRVLAMMKAALNHAFSQGICANESEWLRVPAFQFVDSDGKLLLLTPEQVQRLLDATTSNFCDLLQASVLTGARYGELCNTNVADLDAQAGTLRLNGKTGPRIAHLSTEATRFLKTLTRDKLPSAPLLMRADGGRWKTAQQHRLMREAVERAGLPPETCLNSIRDYYINRAIISGVPPQMVAENCGTNTGVIEKNYSNILYTASDRRRMMNSIVLY